jgi:hypothetical protein
MQAPLVAQEAFLAKDADAKLQALLEELKQAEGMRFQQTKDTAGVYYTCEVKGAPDPVTGNTTYRNIFVWAAPYALDNGGVLKDRAGHEIVKLMFESTVYQLPESVTPTPALLQEVNKRNTGAGWVKTYITSDAKFIVQQSNCWLRNTDSAMLNEELLEIAYGSSVAARDFYTLVQNLQVAPE